MSVDVLANPLDDALRLAYAAECDDPARASLIRQQLTLMALDKGRPRGSLAEIVRLRRATTELIERHGAAWAGALAFLASDLGFSRGFVDHVELDATLFLAQGEQLLSDHPVLSLRLSGLDKAQLDDVLASAVLWRLVALDLTGAALGDDGAIRLAQTESLRGIRWMSLHGCQIGLRGAAALARSETLAELAYLAFGQNPVQITPRPFGRTPDGGAQGYVTPPSGQRLIERYGARPFLTYATTDAAYPPDPYDVLVQIGWYRPLGAATRAEAR